VKRIAPTPQSNLPTLQAAVVEIFHAVCPHPTRYMTQDRLNLDEYKADLAIWMADVTTVWIHLKDTQHHSDCRCCITFRRLATNYENMLKQAMSNYEYEEKRVLVNDIRRWAADVQGSSAKEALSNLKRVARATLTGEDDSCISEMTDDSSNISSASASDTTSVISTQPSITLVHEQEEQSTQSSDEEEEKETPITRLRQRKSVPRPIDEV
jgi:hypothetical protein